jgi:hypothetical protein
LLQFHSTAVVSVSVSIFYKHGVRLFAKRRSSEGQAKLVLNGLTLWFKEHGSEISAEVQAHHIMRSAVEKIHEAFWELKRSLYAYSIANKIALNVIREVWEKIEHLLGDCSVELEEDYSSKYLPIELE